MHTAIILSGGRGVRTGLHAPKQYSVTHARTMISRAMEPFFLHPDIGAVRVVADEAWHAQILQDITAIANGSIHPGGRLRKQEDAAPIRARFRGFSAPGETRALSVVNGLRDCAEESGENDIVILHDAARPFVSAELITRLIEACKEHDGALPVLPMKDTVYRVLSADASGAGDTDRADPAHGGGGLTLLPREEIVAGQAPEAFRFGPYLRACEALLPDRIARINGSTEVALLAGMDVVTVEGEERNYKVTSARDMARYAADCLAQGEKHP
ncbi:MAG: 2-C-methyl-D-erythritol 4-phosphate cytidylyltransferase [Lachnospiraceae bacterium]|nr:2-C-methyl-D-erythritol 4-phosphate cytidylyltransferase [Lachnospiraceae bacterium]